MGPGDHYRIKAAELLAKAKIETDPKLKAEFDRLGRAYLRLIEQANANSHTDIVYETPPPRRDGDRSG
jgi:hypothetical protein